MIIGNQNVKAKYLWNDMSFELVTETYSYADFLLHHDVIKKKTKRLDHL